MMATAQLAQSDTQFNAELQQRYQFNQSDLDLRKKDLAANLTLMGLQGDQLKAAITNEKVKSAMDIAALGMEIGDGSKESMAPFVEQMGAALEGYMKGQGIDVSKSDFVSAMTKNATPAGSIVRDEKGVIKENAKVAGYDVNKMTKEEWKGLSDDPIKLSDFVKSGVVKEVDSLGSITRIADARKALEEAGLANTFMSTSSSEFKFNPQTYIYYQGKPYQVTSYRSELQGTGTFSDKSRNGILTGIDLATGKEVVIKRDRENI
jgi:hypothetical protein